MIDIGKQNGICREALFSDGTEDYRYPTECDAGDTVRLRFRTLKNNADRVILVIADENSEIELEMQKASPEGLFDYYELEIKVGKAAVFYYFEVERGEERCVYTRLGADGGIGHRFYFRITPGFHVPKWMQGCVIYQIFTDRFYNGDRSNDVRTGEYTYLEQALEQVQDWNDPIQPLDVGRFYGGDLAGVLEKLPYLKALGIEAIYFNPLFVSPSNHKYDCQDYEHIDPHFAVIKKDGTYTVRTADPENLTASDHFFEAFIANCHEAGIRVIIDGVFNHCGSFHRMMDKAGIYREEGGYPDGAYESADSPYRSFFRFADERPEAWPDNDSYEKWWGNDTLPKLNYEGSEKLWDYMLSIGRKWVSAPYGADGWRLDVAADLGHSPACNHQFWQDFRKEVRKANPDAVILAEHYGDAWDWLSGNEWDTVMNYDAFMDPVSYFMTGMEKHSDAYEPSLEGDGKRFFDVMRHAQCAMQTQSMQAAMNELSNHDHSRFLTRTNKKIARLTVTGDFASPEDRIGGSTPSEGSTERMTDGTADSMTGSRSAGDMVRTNSAAASEDINIGLFSAAVVLQMTWPGAPTIYYGDEAGLCGWTDPDNRRTFPWGNENHQLQDFHTYMIALHKHEVFRRGSWKELYAGRYVIAYGRMLGKYIAVTVINAGDCTQEIDLPLWQLGVTAEMTITRVVQTDLERYNVGAHHRAARNGRLHCVMGPFSSKVYINWAVDEYNIRWKDVEN